MDTRTTEAGYSVGDVARLTGVTIRTLHHYDEIGLVVPGRTESGHRRYDIPALERLQQVLFFRELEFPLDDIRQIMTDPAFDRREALLHQREMVLGKIRRLEGTVDGIDLALIAIDEGEEMAAQDMFPENPYAEEAKERWGDTDEYKESARRTKSYSKDDWVAIKVEAEAASQRLAEVMRSGAAPTSDEAMDAADAHRRHIDTWFYPCSKDMHRNLAEMYVDDERFTAHWDAYEPGLAVFVRDAIRANATR